MKPLRASLVCVACLVFSPLTSAEAAVITLEGTIGSGVTAELTYDFDDSSDTFSLALKNTSPVGGFITNIGLDLGNALELVSLAHDSSLPYQFTNMTGSPPPPFGPSPSHPTDFGIFLTDQSTGLNVGESVNMTWVLALDGGGAVTGISGDTIARGVGARFRGLSTTIAPAATDIAIYAVPEPASILLIGTGIMGVVCHRGRRARRPPTSQTV